MENITTQPPKKKNPVVFVVLAVILAAGAFFGIRAFLHGRHYESTDNAQIESRSVPVISRVAGYIDSIGVDDFGKVKAGEVLISIDPEEYWISVVQAKADVINAEADIANAEAAYSNGLANKKLAYANAEVQKTRLDKSRSDLDRDEALLKEGAVTDKQRGDSQSAYDAANKQYAANLQQISLAATQVTITEAQLKKAQAQVEIRKAALQQAELKLSYCKVVAPISGKIGKRTIEKGQYIQPGAPLFAVVNDEKFWLVANFKETQLEKMKEGQAVNIVLDGFPDITITGKVASFSQATGAKFALLPADNATGNFVKVTQRIPVKIELDNASQYKHILRAGLSAEVEVNIQ